MKAHDSVKHEVASITLKNLGATPKYERWVEKFRGDFDAVLKVRYEEREMECGCGMRQSDNLVPALLMLIVHLESEETMAALREKC